MLIKSPPGWQLPEASATPENVFMNRRAFVTGATGAMMIAAAPLLAGCDEDPRRPAGARIAAEPDPTKDLYPVPRSTRFVVERAITDEDWASTYNNFMEFGSFKTIYNRAQALKLRPWQVKIDGEVETPQVLDIDDLIRTMPLEERVYRHRCVEAWAMTVPWSGFAMRALVERARPLSSAKYVRLETFKDSKIAGGQRAGWYPWPYVEALTMEEATNDLAFLVTGVYGKPLLKQFGAPLRLAVPWKYGFKSIKSIVRVSFHKERPKTFWERVQDDEYGFWANVNPQVPHPRWSQKSERLLGTFERVPTRIYNGYGEWVADMYKDLKDEKLFM